MNKEQFSKILRAPDQAGSESIPLLKDLLVQFPYFQTARMLRLKLLKDENSVHYRKDLKSTSAYAGDRTKLFHFINGGDLKQMQASAKMGLPQEENPEELQNQLHDQQDIIEEASVEAPEIFEENKSEQDDSNVEIPIIDQINVPDATPIEDFEGITELPYSSETGLSPQEILQKRLDEIKDESDEPTGEIPDSSPDSSVSVEDEESVNQSESEIVEEPVLDLEPKERAESDTAFELEDEITDATDEIAVHPMEITDEAEKISENIEEHLYEDVIEEVIPYASSYIEHVDEQTEPSDESEERESIIEVEVQSSSFVNWLRHLNERSGTVEEVLIRRIEAPELLLAVSAEDDRSRQKDIINHFIKTNPRIERKKAEFYSAQDMAKRSVVDQNELVSETLAKVYADQGLKEQAITAYEQLSLKYPQKMAYFAARIKEINDSGSIK